jgi:subtilisin family serine protease
MSKRLWATVGLAVAAVVSVLSPEFAPSPVASAASSTSPARQLTPDVIAALQDTPTVRVIVSLRVSAAPGAGAAKANPAIAAAAARALASIPSSDFQVDHQYEATPAFAGRVSAAGAQALAAHPDVLSVALDRTVHAELTEAVPLIRADLVQNVLGLTGAGVVVAVLDTGIDTDHPLLADSLIHQECYLVAAVCPAGPNVAEDGNGHGTHVSGIITSNGPPIGVAPGASIEAFKVLDDTGNGEFSDILSAYDQIIAHHPEVDLINMSISDGGTYGPGICDGGVPAATADLAATRAMGITTFAAAGNNHAKNGLGYPACITDVVAVGAVYDANVGAFSCDATTAPDQVTCFSQSDSALDLLAPGALIQSTYVGGGLANLAGTSMASPAAAGVAALLLQSEPSITPANLETRLKSTGKPITDSSNGVITCRVDAYAAVLNAGGPACAAASSVGGIATAPDTAALREPDASYTTRDRPVASVAILVALATFVVFLVRRRRARDG